jgi:carbonic anhydrase/acetyltransferase-like protein (isoleucine patch superfamily)
VYGNAWVSGDAWVYGDARVSGDARVYGNARVSGNAQVSGNAWVYGDARVSGNAQVSGNAWVYGDARVSGDAWVYGDARVYGNAWVSGDAQKTPIHISGLTWPVTILDTHMQIGCEFHSLDDWRGFDDARIAKMGGRNALKFWRAHRDFLLGMAAADGRGIKKEDAA